MMGRSMLQRLRQISISSSLRGAFLMGALLTLIVSSVSLYSWHEQSSQIRYSLDEYFPRIHSAFLIEGNLNLVVDQLNEFLLAPNTTVRLQLRNQIIQHLDKIERLSQGLSPAERQQLAETDIAVWLYGEPGTGRMTGARYLHQLGRHADGPFISCELNTANAHTLNELIAQAQGGTLVLSHLEHLTHGQQHHLVQLQSHEKRPFRLIGIGNASLVELAASSQIVAELYYCFAMTQIGCQPLSKRPDDIEPLFHHYLQKTCQRLNHPVPEVDAGLLKGMMRRVWPNNVRELANAAELFAVGVLPLAETVNPQMLVGEPTPLDRRVEDVERQIITEALNIHQGRINEVAEYLLIPRKKLYLRMKKYGLSKEHYKGG